MARKKERACLSTSFAWYRWPAIADNNVCDSRSTIPCEGGWGLMIRSFLWPIPECQLWDLSVNLYFFQTQLPSQITILRQSLRNYLRGLRYTNISPRGLFKTSFYFYQILPSSTLACIQYVLKIIYLNAAKLTYPTFWVVPLCDFPRYRISDKLFFSTE